MTLRAAQLPIDMTVVAPIMANAMLAQTPGASEGFTVMTHHCCAPSAIDQRAVKPRARRCEALLVNFDSPFQADLQAMPFLDGFRTPSCLNPKAI